MRNNPRFYMMTPAMSGPDDTLDVIAIHSEHNLNVLYMFRRNHNKLALLSCTMDEAYMALNATGGIGIGCYVPSDNIGDNRWRKVASKMKLRTLGDYARGIDVYPSIALRLDPPEVRRAKALLKLRMFN